jgi:ElaB/YqjD/DUF883 family membrane-anchored ribosome-binding protein
MCSVAARLSGGRVSREDQHFIFIRLMEPSRVHCRSLCSKANTTGTVPMNAKVDSLGKTVSSGIAQAQEKANDTLDSAKRTMDHTIDRGKELASDAASTANDALRLARDAGSELAESASGLASELEAMTRKNPLTTVIGAVAIGVVMGMMVRGSR